MRNAKIISYKVKGSFQHNCSMFARRKIFCCFFIPFLELVFFLLPEPSRWYCVLLPQEEAKQQKPIFHFGNNNFPHIIWGLAEGASEREYLKNDEKFPFSAFCFLRPPPPQAFFLSVFFPRVFICERLFRSFSSGNHRARAPLTTHKKQRQMTTPFRFQISEFFSSVWA